MSAPSAPLALCLLLAACEAVPTATRDAGQRERETDDAAPEEEPADEEAGAPRDGAAHRTDAAQRDDAGFEEERAFEPRALTAPPSYLGSLHNGQACNTEYPTVGFEPVTDEDERYPLFLYFVGTAFDSTDPASRHDHDAALAVTRAMARRGFVALSAAYDNGALAWLSNHKNQLTCLFDGADSLLARACALPQVDCDLGIATWGHSQGGYVAVMAGNYEPRVRAAWATGYGGDASSKLSPHRLRVVNGEADTTNGTASVLNGITGLTAGDCPDPDQCLRSDGSGWIIVRKSALSDPASSSADHCWFYKAFCTASGFRLEPSWIDPLSTRSFAIEPNADWVASTVRRGP